MKEIEFKPATRDSMILFRRYTPKADLVIQSISLADIEILIANDYVLSNGVPLYKGYVELVFSINELDNTQTYNFLRELEVHRNMSMWTNVIIQVHDDCSCTFSNMMSEVSVKKYIKWVTCKLNKVDKDGYYIIYKNG